MSIITKSAIGGIAGCAASIVAYLLGLPGYWQVFCALLTGLTVGFILKNN